MAVDSAMEVLVEELIDLHSSSLSFRELFKSHQNTALLVDACRSFVARVAVDPMMRTKAVRILKKVTQLVLMLALDNKHVNSMHNQEVSPPYRSLPLDNVARLMRVQLLAIVRIAEESHGSGQNGNLIDPSVIAINGTTGHSRPRSNTTQRSLQMLGDRTYQKSLTRIREWQKMIIRTERKRLRKLFQDLCVISIFFFTYRQRSSR